MNKIIAAIDGLKPSSSTMQYAIELAKQNQAHLVAVFLDDFTYTGYKIYDLVKADAGFIGSEKRKLDHKDAKARAQAASRFEANCQEAGIAYTVHHDKGYAIQELLHESVFADLVIIDSRETLQHHPQKSPTDFIKDLLAKAQCPVLVVPHVYKPIQQLIYLYDGEPSSLHAIKMFNYTLPAMAHYKLKTVYVNWTGAGNHLPYHPLLKEWMKRHYDSVEYTVLKGNPEDEILNYLGQLTETSLVVLGAYSRNMVSRWLKPSLANTLLKEIKLPFFIAH